ncbi:alpha/beta-hydrolase [Mycena sp. CBHHK59/15]|nr:alpha/beta-hydrolase [Mycena sp. CBHHK59/15]KAJ6620147.1 alpha/beta-hydrolase [Mycena sp. CBHHK59/15]
MKSEMNQSHVKQVKTQRGFTYSYYFSPPAAGKPVIFFSHGFPSGAYLWRKQIAFFEPLGYGLVVPDLLGYGGTDKPTDPKFYVGSGLAQDVIDIFNNEGIEQAIALGHDWGSRVVSRLLNYHPQRVVACAFFGIGYGPPDSEYADPIAKSQMIKKMVGYDVLAYMQFFIQPDAAPLLEKNFDSFFSLLYPETPETWKDTMCVSGGAKAWIESNQTAPLPSYLSPQEKEHYQKQLLDGGLSAPLCWYKVLIEAHNTKDDGQIPVTSHAIRQPCLFVAFTRDVIGLPLFGDGTHTKYVTGAYTRKEVAGGHWGVESHADELNQILLEWLGGLDK